MNAMPGSLVVVDQVPGCYGPRAALYRHEAGLHMQIYRNQIRYYGIAYASHPMYLVGTEFRGFKKCSVMDPHWLLCGSGSGSSCLPQCRSRSGTKGTKIMRIQADLDPGRSLLSKNLTFYTKNYTLCL